MKRFGSRRGPGDRRSRRRSAECQEGRDTRLEPSTLFGAIPFIVVPMLLKMKVAHALSESGVPMDGSEAAAAEGGSHTGRHRRGGRGRRLEVGGGGGGGGGGRRRPRTTRPPRRSPHPRRPRPRSRRSPRRPRVAAARLRRRPASSRRHHRRRWPASISVTRILRAHAVHDGQGGREIELDGRDIGTSDRTGGAHRHLYNGEHGGVPGPDPPGQLLRSARTYTYHGDGARCQGLRRGRRATATLTIS